MAKVVIDPGHGGIDSGAVGNDIIEKDLNLKISKYIYDRLKDLGVDVKITRETDETLTPDERVKKILNAFGNTGDVIVISNHINSGGGANPSGKLTFFEKFIIIGTKYYYYFFAS